MADQIQLIIVISFAALILVLAQSRELMRQIARTAEEWHRMRNAMRGPRHPRKFLTGAADPADGNTARAASDQITPEDQ